MDSHSHFHVAGRKGTAWVCLYTGVNSLAYNEILQQAATDVTWDEIRPCGHITPGHIFSPKEIEANRKRALENIKERSAEEIAIEKEALEEDKRRQELRQAEHAVKVLFASEQPKTKELQDKLEADIKTAQSKVAAIKQAHADLAERKAIDAELSRIMIEDAARAEKAAALQDRRKQLSKSK